MRTAVDNAASWQTRVPYSPRSAGTVRRWLGDIAGNLDGSMLADLCAVATELVCNAVRHARPLPGDELSIHYQLLGTTVEFSVTDGGANTEPEIRAVDNCSPDGRGLQIVDALTSQWGVTDDSGKRTVWARLSG